MSFILESLQRAQRDRRTGKAPDLEQEYREPPLQPQRRRRWPWAAATAALVIVFAAAGFALWRLYPGPETPAVDPAVKNGAAPEKAGSAGLPAAQASKGRPTPPTAVSRPRPPQARVERKSAPNARPLAKEARVPRPMKPTPAEAPLSPEPAGTIDVRPPAPATDDVHHTMLPGMATVADEEPLEIPDDGVEPTDENPPQIAPREPVEAQPPSNGGAPGPPVAVDLNQVPLVTDLPPEIRDKLVKLTINVHGYFDNPERRVVYINMQRYRVGDTIAPDNFLLEAITPEGVVINYGEGRARLLVRR